MLRLAASAQPGWAEACSRAEVSFDGKTHCTPMLASTGARRSPPLPDVGSRALCSWALTQVTVLEAPDAESLEAALREFMEVNVFSEPLPGASVSSDIVQFHYKAVMPASEWEAEWQPMLAHFRRERSGKGREEAAEAVA